MSLDVAIVGAGIGGLSAALSCAHRCAPVVKEFNATIYERADAISEVGAGLQISPNASRILIGLGLGDRLEAASFSPQALELRQGSTGRLIFSLPMGDSVIKRYGAPYYHLHRADLIELLLEAVSARGDVQIKTKSPITGISHEQERVRPVCSSGPNLSSADILIGADGVKSVVRHELLGPDPAQFTGNVAWRAVVKATPELKALIPPTATVWSGRKRHAVTYYLRGGQLINFVGVIESKSWTKESWSESGDVAELRENFKSFAKPVRALIDAMETCFIWALHGRDALPFWSQGPIAVLGDAAHPMLPFQAQGAAQAIEDADVLSRVLSTVSEDDISTRLMQYQAVRLPRATRIQKASHANMHIFHQGDGLRGLMTYGPMALAARLTPAFVQSRQDWIYGHIA